MPQVAPSLRQEAREYLEDMAVSEDRFRDLEIAVATCNAKLEHFNDAMERLEAGQEKVEGKLETMADTLSEMRGRGAGTRRVAVALSTAISLLIGGFALFWSPNSCALPSSPPAQQAPHP